MNKWTLLLLGLGGAGLLLLTGGVAVNLADKASWAAYVYARISAVLPQLSVQARLILLAQAAFESGWGSVSHLSPPGNTNDIFNVTTTGTGSDGWSGSFYQQANADDQYNADGTVTRISQKWRVYPSIDAAIQDMWTFLSGPRYAAQNVLGYLQNGDLTGYVNALSTAGYFTLPADQYLSRMQGVFNTAASYVGVSATA